MKRLRKIPALLILMMLVCTAGCGRHTLTPFFQNMRPEETPESMEAVLGLPEKPPRKRWRKLPAETALPMRVPEL